MIYVEGTDLHGTTSNILSHRVSCRPKQYVASARKKLQTAKKRVPWTATNHIGPGVVISEAHVEEVHQVPRGDVSHQAEPDQWVAEG